VNHDELNRCLEAGLAAVLEAGPIALEYFRRPMAVSDKRLGGHYDPVTEADRRIEALIRERLRRDFPYHRVVGEEHGAEGEGAACWYIDPIDGTRAFISGMPTWGILLGLVVEGRPQVGIMHQPFTGETWYAAPGVGARLRIGDRETALCTRGRLARRRGALQHAPLDVPRAGAARAL
jgi:myo-inositol-1(or 4)-monophosphatase